MAIVQHASSLPDLAQKTDFYAVVDGSSVSNIVNADISANAGILGSKLASLSSIVSGAGVIPIANIPTIPSAVVTAVPADDHTATGLKIVLTAHANVAFGDVCYINSDGEAQLIDASAIATMSGIVMCADATITANASGNWLLNGVARDDTWSWTVGGLIYGTITGTTTNTMSQTAPTGTDEVIQILGVATNAKRMIFNPSLSQVEHL